MSASLARLRIGGGLLLDSLGGSTGLLVRLPRYLSRLADGSACRLADSSHGLTSRLADTLSKRAHALTESADRLTRGVAQLADGPSRAECLPGRVSQAAERLTGGSSRLHGLLRCLPDVVERLRHRSARPERLLAEIPDVADGVVDRLHEALENLRVPVECRQGAVEDVVEVLEANFQPRLRFDSFDVDLDLAEVNMHAGDHLQEVRELGTQREVSFELLHVDVDLVDVNLVDVDEDVGIVARFAALEVARVELAR